MTDDALARIAAEHSNNGHSIFSPSSAHRWSTCLGSLIACALAPEDSSFYAAEGTVAHHMADLWLRSGVRPMPRMVEQDGYMIDANDEMLAYVEQYVEWCQEAVGQHYFEQRVDLSAVMPIPDQGGTADHMVCSFGHGTVTDLKYGKGRKVDLVYADGTINRQLMLYALGVFFEHDWFYDFQTITIRVCQPRLDHFPVVTVTRADLLAFRDWIAERAKEAWRLDAPRTPGEHCWKCGGIRDCPAYLTWFASLAEAQADDVFDVPAMAAANEKASDMFDDEPVIPLPELSVEAWCRILTMRSAVEAWFAAGELKVMQAALNGDAPGWKVVEGRSNRAWADEDDAIARMVEVGVPEDQTYTKKTLSPNQAEELLHASTRMPKKKARELFDSYTERVRGSRTLVRALDKREALPIDGDVFDGE